MAELSREAQAFSYFEVSGFSMWPFLKNKDRLIIRTVSTRTLEVGDIILYRSEDGLVCHRLVKIVREANRCLLYCRGDASLSSPEFVDESALVGKASGVVKKKRVVSLEGKTRHITNRLIVILAPFSAILTEILRKFMVKR